MSIGKQAWICWFSSENSEIYRCGNLEEKEEKQRDVFLLQRLVVEERPALRCHSVRYLSLTQTPWLHLRGGGEKPAYSSMLFIYSSLKDEEELSSVDLSPLPKKCWLHLFELWLGEMSLMLRDLSYLSHWQGKLLESLHDAFLFSIRIMVLKSR